MRLNKTDLYVYGAREVAEENITLVKQNSSKHIILLGFKHVGKSLIGRRLAKSLNIKYIDLDRTIEKLFKKNQHISLSCRQIMQSHGDRCFRELETKSLTQVLKSAASVISLGGGTVLSKPNQEMVKPHLLLHVIAPCGIVFERIMVDGHPAFFDPQEEPYESFSRLWNERDKIYRKIATYTINNNGTVTQAVNEALRAIVGQINI